MISTFQALAVTLLALLPGASYTFAYERRVGGFGVSLSDRLVRFLAASALFGALFSGPGLLAYSDYVASGRLGRGQVKLLWFELAVLAYVLLPTLVGSFIGTGQLRRWRWVVALVGDAPEPRAWDYLWRPGVQGVVRLKLKSGSWLAGTFGTTASGQRSYAAGYPEAQDLYLSLQLKVDPATGAFEQDPQGPCGARRRSERPTVEVGRDRVPRLPGDHLMAAPHETQDKSLTGSGFEKKGGYASPKTPVASLPKVPAGPAPGASPRPATERR